MGCKGPVWHILCCCCVESLQGPSRPKTNDYSFHTVIHLTWSAGTWILVKQTWVASIDVFIVNKSFKWAKIKKGRKAQKKSHTRHMSNNTPAITQSQHQWLPPIKHTPWKTTLTQANFRLIFHFTHLERVVVVHRLWKACVFWHIDGGLFGKRELTSISHHLLLMLTLINTSHGEEEKQRLGVF